MVYMAYMYYMYYRSIRTLEKQLIEEIEVGQDPVMKLSVYLQIFGTKTRWYAYLKDNELGWFDKYSEASNRIHNMKESIQIILEAYFEHDSCAICDVFRTDVKRYVYVTRKSEESDAGTWTDDYCPLCLAERRADEDTISVKEWVESDE